MVQHTLPKGFKRIRYDGVQATKTCAKVKVAIHVALAKVEGVVKGAVKIIARLTYRQRYERSTGRDPLVCSHCGGEMGLWRIWHPTYGGCDRSIPKSYGRTAGTGMAIGDGRFV
jgi:hypothetical protein